METELDYSYQGKRRGGGCTGKAGFLMLMLFLLFAAIANAQTKPPPTPSVLLSPMQVDRILFGIDSVAVVIVRSDMIKQDRNYATDKLTEIRMYLLGLFREQNVVKVDTVRKEK